jgi:hypothetical protein
VTCVASPAFPGDGSGTFVSTVTSALGSQEKFRALNSTVRLDVAHLQFLACFEEWA